MALTTNAAPAYAAIAFNAANENNEKRTSRRLANREAMSRIEANMAANGQSIGSVEDWMNLSREALGPGAFLNTGSPTVDGVEAILKNQNAQAAIKTEEMRRAKFTADEAEKQTIEKTAGGLFSSGMDALTVSDKLGEQYGVDQVKARGIDYPRLQSTAQREAMTRGMTYGAGQFDGMEMYTDYIQGNPGIPEFEKQGMFRAAEIAERKRSSDIATMATSLGGSGPITPEAARFELHSQINSAFPNSSPEKLNSMVETGVKLALAASGRRQVADQQKITQEAALSAIKDGERVNQTVYAMQDAEVKRKELAAQQARAAGEDVMTQQGRMVEAALKDKNLSSTKKMELQSSLSGLRFLDTDANLYVQAVVDGDTKAMEKLKARAQPVAAYLANVRALSDIISGAQRLGSIADVDRAYLGLGMSQSAIARIGIEIAKNDSVVNTATPQAATNRPNMLSGLPRRTSPSDRSVGIQEASVSGVNEMTETARLTSESLLKGFRDNMASFIGDMNESLRLNGSLSASTEEMAALSTRTVLARTRALTSGMGLTPEMAEQKAQEITQSIINTIPASQPMVKKVDQAERYKAEYQQRLQGLGVRSGYIPGAAQPYPASGQSQPYQPRF
jgi:hypothetical protein